MIKTAYLLGSLNRGGAETLLLDCFRNATAAGFSFIGVYRKEGVLSGAFQSTDVPLFRIAPSSKFDICYIFRLRKLLAQHHIGIVHAQQPLDALYGKLACIGTQRKIVLTFHGYEQDCSSLDKRLIKWIIGKTDLNIFVSQHQKDEYNKHYSIPTATQAVVYNGIDFSKMSPTANIHWRRELNINDSVFLLGSVGNFNAVRDQLSICHFLKLLDQNAIDFRFLFAGKQHPGEEWRYEQCINYCLENQLSDKVIFLGSRPDVAEILSQLDAFIYASDHDSFGIAVIEAIASETPVFVNDWHVMREVTQQGKYAHLYKTQDIADLFHQFTLAMTQRSTLQAEAQNAAHGVKMEYGIQKHLSTLKAVYRKLMANA